MPKPFTSSKGHRVFLNKWMGKKFENQTVCFYCNKLGNVVEIPGTMTRICQSCLNELNGAIYEGILSRIPKWVKPE